MPHHLNSLIAYQEELTKLSKRATLIYGYLVQQQRSMTDREIKDVLFGVTADCNTTRPRISDLIKAGWLREVGKVRDHVTGKRVRKTRALTPEQRSNTYEPDRELDFFTVLEATAHPGHKVGAGV